MAVRNYVFVYIDGINYSRKLVLPLKIGELLDERLDECTISLRGVKMERFAPMTPVEIVIRNDIFVWQSGYEHSYRYTPNHHEETVKYFLIADDVAEEHILGRGLYNHDLALIEVTRAAELVVVDTITFTNDIGRNYTENAKAVSPYISDDGY